VHLVVKAVRREQHPHEAIDLVATVWVSVLGEGEAWGERGYLGCCDDLVAGVVPAAAHPRGDGAEVAIHRGRRARRDQLVEQGRRADGTRSVAPRATGTGRRRKSVRTIACPIMVC